VFRERKESDIFLIIGVKDAQGSFARGGDAIIFPVRAGLRERFILKGFLAGPGFE